LPTSSRFEAKTLAEGKGATLLGAKDDDMLRYFILIVALRLDPPRSSCCWPRLRRGGLNQDTKRKPASHFRVTERQHAVVW
jgi:hypothetical protein